MLIRIIANSRDMKSEPSATVTKDQLKISIADRTKEGLNAARSRGRIGGRPKTDGEHVKKAVKLYNTKQYSLKEIYELTGVKKSTLYRNLA